MGKWRKALSGDIPQITCTVQRNGTTYTLHLPASPRQAQPQAPHPALRIVERLVILGLSQEAALRLRDRLAALSPAQRRQAERLLQALLL